MAIGNAQSPIEQGPVPAIPRTLIYDDMNASTGGVARGTSIPGTFTTVYSYSGQGLIYGFNLGLENIDSFFGGSGWFVRFLLDGNDVFVGSGGLNIGDCLDDDIYALQINAGNDMVSTWGGIIILNSVDGNFRWEPPFGRPVAFDESCVIQVRKNGTNRDFNGGLVIRS